MLQQIKTYIIIVTYNGMKWLPECLESNSSYPVIVVDNGSNDGSKEFIKENFPSVILLEQKENLGFGRANNIGMSYALENNADFVFLLNQDAFLGEKTIQALIDISIKNPDYGIISPVHLTYDGKALEEVFKYYIYKDAYNDLLSNLLVQEEIKDIYSFKMVNAAAWLIPRKTLEIVGGFHPMFFLYGEDDNYCQRVLYHNLKIGVCPKIFIRHDSKGNYHLVQEKGNKKYFDRLLNQIKVEYADVNTNNQGKFKKLKYHYFRKGIISLFSLKLENYRFNLRKYNMIKKLDFTKDIEEGRMKKGLYINMEN